MYLRAKKRMKFSLSSDSLPRHIQVNFASLPHSLLHNLPPSSSCASIVSVFRSIHRLWRSATGRTTLCEGSDSRRRGSHMRDHGPQDRSFQILRHRSETDRKNLYGRQIYLMSRCRSFVFVKNQRYKCEFKYLLSLRVNGQSDPTNTSWTKTFSTQSERISIPTIF